MLTGWRVLDLTDHRGEVGPFMLADLGAEVVKVEPPGGCPTRRSDPHQFAAYNANKRLVELSGRPATDRRLVLDLVATADLVFDSGPSSRLPGLSSLGIGDVDVTTANPRAVIVLVTPFGSDGPRADQPASELTLAALGGIVRQQGTPDRAPVHFSVPQVWRHAGAEAAVAALIAHARMEATGEPQFVDVSAQACMTWTMLNGMEAHAIQGHNIERTGPVVRIAQPVRFLLEAADGYVIGVPTARSARPLVPWLVEEGIVETWWADVDWPTYDRRVARGEDVEVPLDEVVAAVEELCRRHTREELLMRGVVLGASLAPLNTLADLLAFDHLDARGFWSAAAAETEAGVVRLPGAFWRRNGQRRTVQRGWPHARGAGAELADDESADGATASGEERAGEQLPLAGLKVADFSWVGVGPITAKVLADHGAEVVRVESRGHLDRLRQAGPFLDGEPGSNRSQFYGSFNTSKLGLSLDLKSPVGVRVARELIGWADVMIESFTPGTIDRLGLGYDEASALNPSLIMVSTSLLGPGGPVASLAGYGYHAAAIAGFHDLVGWPDLPPDGPYLAYTDTVAPRFIATLILAAIRHRRRTGEGGHLEVAQLEASLQFLAPELAAYQRSGELPHRNGNRATPAAGIAPQGVYPCRGTDEWLAISVVDDQRWAVLIELLGGPAWALDSALSSVAGRQAAHGQIDAELARWTAGHDGCELERRLADRGIAAGLVQGSRHLSDDPQYLHRRFYRHLEHTEMGLVPYAGHQYRIRGYDHGPRWAAPCLGEHTEHVLVDLLGLPPGLQDC